MSTTKFRILLAVVFALFVVAPVWGQPQGEDATGTVLDADKKPVAKAKVTLKDKEGKVVAEVLTDASGNFSVKVPVGEDYTASVDAEALTLGGIQVPVNTVKSAVRKLGELFLPPKKVAQVVMEEAKGLVLSEGRKPVAKATVTIQAMSSGQSTKVVTNDAGEFRAQLPPAQKYEISIEAKDLSPVIFQTTREGLQILSTILQPAPAPSCGNSGVVSWGAALMFALLYSLFAITVRYHNILRVNRKMLKAELDALSRKAEVVAAEGVKKRVDMLLEDAAKSLKPEKSPWLPAFFLGFRGEENAAHTSIRHAEELLLESYNPDQIISGLRLAAEQLRPEYTNMAAKIEADLALLGGANSPGIDFLRCELTNAVKCVNEKKRIAGFGVMNWQNKAFALVLGGCFLLAATATFIGNPTLLFVGLVGGFFSRLMRGRTMNSSDGSLTWTALFLSPLYGAFAGWTGVLLITVLTELGVLGPALNRLHWSEASCTNLGLGIAFLFGFSERFFSAVTEMAEAAILKRKNATAADATEVKPTAVDPKAGIQSAAPLVEPIVTSASLTELVLTLQGKNLKGVKQVKLKPLGGAESALELQSPTDVLLTAKASAAPASGCYQVLLDGKTVISIIVP